MKRTPIRKRASRLATLIKSGWRKLFPKPSENEPMGVAGRVEPTGLGSQELDPHKLRVFFSSRRA